MMDRKKKECEISVMRPRESSSLMICLMIVIVLPESTSQATKMTPNKAAKSSECAQRPTCLSITADQTTEAQCQAVWATPERGAACTTLMTIVCCRLHEWHLKDLMKEMGRYLRDSIMYILHHNVNTALQYIMRQLL